MTANDIFEKLAEKKIEVEKRQIFLSEPIKVLGEKKISIKVGFDLEAEITVNVLALETES